MNRSRFWGRTAGELSICWSRWDKDLKHANLAAERLKYRFWNFGDGVVGGTGAGC
jgi:hypothetical protein